MSIWVALSDRFPIKPGLDLQGGLQVLLEADVPADEPITAEQMDNAKQTIERRINALNVIEPLIQTEGERRILVELPGIDDPQQAINLIQETALLEFVDTGRTPLLEGQCIRTSLNEGRPSSCEDLQPLPDDAPQYATVITGAELASARAEGPNEIGEYFVGFEVRSEAQQTFEDFTRENIGNFLTIVLDKQVISSPTIQAVISNQGSISGNFTLEEANFLALQLRAGSLPVPLRIESTRQIGATLGAASVEDSIRAGIIGLAVVLLFMAVYYRVPGVLADLALIVYALINFTAFQVIGVTLTLPAITGFLLSTGMAVDANILVFERMKEELRRGISLNKAIETGFERAWTSIRDSNIATLVICFILWAFGRNFGASTVAGFAITLAIGVMVSMFTAVVVTRTFVRMVLGRAPRWFQARLGLLGV